MKSYSTSQIAKIMKVHPNTVIMYEKWGHIEKVNRSQNGYRVFTEKHLIQMKIARLLINGDLIKIEFRMKSYEIINSVVNGDMELALHNAKEYLKLLKRDIEKDSIAIKNTLTNLKKLKIENGKYKTNEIAKIIDVSGDLLIYWERNGLIEVERNPKNNYRVYSDKDLALFNFIKPVKELNYISSSICKMINDIKFSNNKNIKEIVYDLNLSYEFENEYFLFVEPLKDIENVILKVINYISEMKKGGE